MKYEPVRKEFPKMKICVISTSALCTPPTDDGYAGIERMAWLAVRGLSELGHTVHLIAKTGSGTPPNGKLFEIEDDKRALSIADMLSREFGVEAYLDESHDKLLSIYRPEYKQLSRYEVMSATGNPRCPVLISEGQRREKFNDAPWPIIPQSIDLESLPLYEGERDEYALCLTQKIREKRVPWACEVAVRTNTPLYIHGPGWSVDPEIERYSDSRPDLIHNEGEVGGAEKLQKLQHAKALIHLPGALGWSEAGGIVVLEALATGTPVIVSRNGALPSYVVQEKNGFIVDSVEEAVDALGKIETIRPEDCRKSVERFDYRRNALLCEALLKRVIAGEQWA